MAGTKAYGAVVTWANGTKNFAIAQVTKIGSIVQNTEVVDITTHDAATDYREYTPTIANIEPVQIEFLFDPIDESHVELRDQVADSAEGVIGSVVINNSTDTNSAVCLVSEFTVKEQSVDGLLMGAATFKPCNNNRFFGT